MANCNSTKKELLSNTPLFMAYVMNEREHSPCTCIYSIAYIYGDVVASEYSYWLISKQEINCTVSELHSTL